jgi:hypothetical protein
MSICGHWAVAVVASGTMVKIAIVRLDIAAVRIVVPCDIGSSSVAFVIDRVRQAKR